MADDNLNDIALIIMYIGFFGWIISALLFIFQGFYKDGRIKFKKALFWFIMIFVMIAVWITGMLFLGYHE